MRLSLEIACRERREVTERTAAGPDRILMDDARRGRVLLVDGDLASRQSFERLLRARGMDTDVATNADEAIAHARKHQYDLVICDLLSPRIDGLSVIRHVRPTQQHAHYVATTTLEPMKAELLLERAALDAVVWKPWDPDELLGVVDRYTAPEAHGRAAEPGTSPYVTGTVLIVDEDPSSALSLEAHLLELMAPTGRVLHARTLGQALSLLAQHSIQAVLLDLSLSDAEGVEGLVRISELGSEVPIVAISGSADEALAMQVVRAGAQDYLVKDQIDPRTLSRVVRHAIERKRSQVRLTRVALFDQLTGAANRTLFSEKLERAVRRGRAERRRFGLLFVDLDHFKAVNDQLGHDVGDALLSAFAMRLSDCLTGSDLLARLGGDEFAILSERVRSREQGRALSRKINGALRTPFELGGHRVVIGASVGIAIFPYDGRDEEQLLRHADADMYRDKGHRRRSPLSGGPYPEAIEHRHVEANLRPAFERGEFEPHYQPVLNLSSGATELVEMLMRWRRPGDGLVQPDAFLPVLDESGLIIPVGRRVLSFALHDLRSFRALSRGDLRLSINVTSAQVSERNFVSDALLLLEMNGLAPSTLELEVSESLLTAGSRGIEGALIALRAEGVRVCIDDFGTGTSSLTLLKRAPLSAVKLDRSLTRDLVPGVESRATVSAVVALARGLGLTVIAEGVETEVQHGMLKDLGCELAQGMFYAAPMPAAALSAWLRG